MLRDVWFGTASNIAVHDRAMDGLDPVLAQALLVCLAKQLERRHYTVLAGRRKIRISLDMTRKKSRSKRVVSGASARNLSNKAAHKPAPAKRRDAIVTKRRILEGALKEFAAKGFDAARIEDISDQAGTNRRMAYYYFGSKEGLYLAALETSYLQLVEVEEAIDVEALGPIEAI
jgi:Bacterial regulatory proteins, tetR family